MVFPPVMWPHLLQLSGLIDDRPFIGGKRLALPSGPTPADALALDRLDIAAEIRMVDRLLP